MLARPGRPGVGLRGTFHRRFPQVFPKTAEINISNLLKRRRIKEIPPERLNRGLSRPPGREESPASLRNRREKEGEMIAVDRIREVEIFQGLKDEELKAASRYCQEEEVPAGTTLCQEGGRADKLFILEEGTVCISFKKGVHFEIRGPGKILGWSFLVPPNRYTASAVTATPAKLLTIKSPDFYELVNGEAKIGLRIMDNLSRVVAGRLKTFVDIH